MLCDVPQVINLRVCAPMEFRVRVMMERQGRNDAAGVREEIDGYDYRYAAADKIGYERRQPIILVLCITAVRQFC
jgi:hypothetical protein